MVTLYHNPRCSKSREALALLQARGVEPRIVRYLDTPPDAAALRQLLRQLGLPARELLRRKEEEYLALGLDDPQLDDEALIAAMVAHPKLIERPIAIQGRRAIIGRPPEKILELLQ
ncbi:MAG TPA: arsenate reductase (glutaredoxin) [Moraxellaceae bacterium]